MSNPKTLDPLNTIHGLYRSYQNNSTKPSIVVQAYLDEIERLNPRLGAYQNTWADTALEMAAAEGVAPAALGLAAAEGQATRAQGGMPRRGQSACLPSGVRWVLYRRVRPQTPTGDLPSTGEHLADMPPAWS